MNAMPKQINRDDIEHKLRELQGDIEDVGGAAKSYALVVGAAVAVAVVGVAYLLGRRRGKKRSTVVEIRRI
jgi:hypothetical protein